MRCKINFGYLFRAKPYPRCIFLRYHVLWLLAFGIKQFTLFEFLDNHLYFILFEWRNVCSISKVFFKGFFKPLWLFGPQLTVFGGGGCLLSVPVYFALLHVLFYLNHLLAAIAEVAFHSLIPERISGVFISLSLRLRLGRLQQGKARLLLLVQLLLQS